MSTESEVMHQYNVLVDFHTSKDMDVVSEQFSNAIHVESIGTNQYQVGLGAFAPNEGEAYRRAVNVVKSEMEILNADPAILSGSVYGPDDDDPTVFE